jgi:tight adherence protein C
MDTSTAMLLGYIIAVGGILFFLLGIQMNTVNEVSKRLRDYVEDSPGKPRILPLTTEIRQAELKGSFRRRILEPWIAKITDFLGSLTPGNLSRSLENDLMIAGNPFGLTPRGFYFVRMGSTLVGFLLAFVMVRAAIAPDPTVVEGIAIPVTGSGSDVQSTSPNPMIMLVWAAFALLIFTNLPKTWLRRKARRRKAEITRAMPDALDMLSVCADAGLGFDQSVQRVSEAWDTSLSNEFARVVAEMGMGLPRHEALRNFADRVNVPDVSSFVAVILQSDQLGMSITQTLHAQAKQMRIERRFRAQEQARKMPLKMLFPLLLFIFPSMFAVILGPMVPVLAELFDTLRNSAIY